MGDGFRLIFYITFDTRGRRLTTYGGDLGK